MNCASLGLVTCDNAQCIEENQVCDGKPDCFDNSDEAYCSELRIEIQILAFCEARKASLRH